MDKQSMREFLEEIQALNGKADRELADAVLEVSTRANQETVEKLKGDGNMCQALLEIMEPEINKIVKVRVESAVESAMKSVAKSAKEEAVRTATKMLKSGKFSVEEIMEYNPRLSLEEIRMLAADVSNI